MNNADTALLKTRGKYEKALHEFHAATATQEKAIRAQQDEIPEGMALGTAFGPVAEKPEGRN